MSLPIKDIISGQQRITISTSINSNILSMHNAHYMQASKSNKTCLPSFFLKFIDCTTLKDWPAHRSQMDGIIILLANNIFNLNSGVQKNSRQVFIEIQNNNMAP